MPNSINITLTEPEAIEVVNHIGFSVYHALEDDDDNAWEVIRTSLGVIHKIEEAFPELIEADTYLCAKEIAVVRRRLRMRDERPRVD